MRCKICNADSDTVTLTDDCSECQSAIQECLDGYPDIEEDNIVDGDYDEIY